ncbi:ribosome hibernation-promoting factor, HPF/YfiA family [Kribbia dieselivorans]|uniref:ribosome hibernation-promoting factor, HPF/YfiA family n=1 Tax=Kribbia dieselivorans TaxID=331526 RepID=UPI00083869DC|nr:ribosome-associated translation inhibitor RaiA [Kribbia dieselivorans]
MDIVVTGRHVQITDRFREHVIDKLDKISQFEARMQRVDVLVTHEGTHRGTKDTERVEITCRAKGPTIRAEACSDDKYAALDLALDKLLERLRRASDRRRVHRGRRTPESVARATAHISEELANHDHPPVTEESATEGPFGDSPVEVREKWHSSPAMTLDQALYEMELVGHDFFLYHDSDTDRPSVVYRRRGWSYGVIHLEVIEAPTEAADNVPDVARTGVA